MKMDYSELHQKINHPYWLIDLCGAEGVLLASLASPSSWHEHDASNNIDQQLIEGNTILDAHWFSFQNWLDLIQT